MDIVVILGVDSSGIFVDGVTEGIDPDVAREVCVFGDVVVAVLDAFVTVGFVVVLDSFVIVNFVVVLDALIIVVFVVLVMVAVVGVVVGAVVDVEIVVVVGVVGVAGDAVDGFGIKPEIRKNISNYS